MITDNNYLVFIPPNDCAHSTCLPNQREKHKRYSQNKNTHDQMRETLTLLIALESKINSTMELMSKEIRRHENYVSIMES